MLKNLVNGILPSQAIIIEDSADYSGHKLLQSFMRQLCQDGQHKVHMMCFENPIETSTGIKFPNLDFHDCFSDSRGWINDGAAESSQESCSLSEAVKKAIGEDRDFVLIIDSLSPIIFNSGFVQCYKDLHLLVSKSVIPGCKLKQLICLVHEDFIPNRDSSISKLRHFATTYLQIHPPAKGNSGKTVVQITHKKPGGKVIKKVEQFSLEEGHMICSEIEYVPRVSGPIIDQPSNMDSLTSFKLELREEEKVARSKVVLPYIRSENKSDEGGGKIFYHPDAADDWDEEDPDDDLDV